MKWMRERDLLIAQTMAFVQSVTGKRPESKATGSLDDAAADAETASVDAIRVALQIVDPSYAPADDSSSRKISGQEILAQDTSDPEAESPPSGTGDAAAAPAVSQALTSIHLPQAGNASDYRMDIKNRIASFRAHQERFKRERDAYFSETLAKARDAGSDDRRSAPPRR